MEVIIDGIATRSHAITSVAMVCEDTITLRPAGVRSGRKSAAPAADGGVRSAEQKPYEYGF